MKNSKFFLIILLIPLIVSKALIAKKEFANPVEQRKYDISHHPDSHLLHSKDPAHPIAITLQNPSKSTVLHHLSHAEKVEKNNADRETKVNITDFVHDRSNRPFHYLEAHHFAKLDDEDTNKMFSHFIGQHNKHLHEELLHAKKDYMAALAKFKNSTQPEAMTAVKKLEKATTLNDQEIKNLKRKLALDTISDEKKSHFHTSLKHLQKQNLLNNISIHQHLTMLENELKKIDQTFTNAYNKIVTQYHNKNDEFRSTVNALLRHKGQSMLFKMPDVKKTPSVTLTPTETGEESADTIEPFMPTVPLSQLAEHPMLDLKIKHLKGTVNQLYQQSHTTHTPEYKTAKDELAYHLNAKALRDR